MGCRFGIGADTQFKDLAEVFYGHDQSFDTRVISVFTGVNSDNKAPLEHLSNAKREPVCEEVPKLDPHVVNAMKFLFGERPSSKR